MATQEMDLIIKNLTADLQSQIDSFAPKVEAVGVGEVIEVGDGIARVSGLADVQSNERGELPDGTLGGAVNTGEDGGGVSVLG